MCCGKQPSVSCCSHAEIQTGLNASWQAARTWSDVSATCSHARQTSVRPWRALSSDQTVVNEALLSTLAGTSHQFTGPTISTSSGVANPLSGASLPACLLDEMFETASTIALGFWPNQSINPRHCVFAPPTSSALPRLSLTLFTNRSGGYSIVKFPDFSSHGNGMTISVTLSKQ